MNEKEAGHKNNVSNFSPSFRISAAAALSRQDSSDDIRTNRFTFVLPNSLTSTSAATSSSSSNDASDAPSTTKAKSSDFSPKK